MKVYVVAWQYDAGTGFDWFPDEQDASIAYETHVESAQDQIDNDPLILRFDYESQQDDPRAITREVLLKFIDLCTRATIKTKVQMMGL